MLDDALGSIGSILVGSMRHSLTLPLVLTAMGSWLTACGPSTTPEDPECGTEDVQTEAELLIGLDGPSCDPCPAEAELIIATTLSTECGPVQWRTHSTCLVGLVSATRAADGQVYNLPPRYCGSAGRNWSIVPGDPLVVQEIFVSEVFGVSPIPAGTYVFEAVLSQLLSTETVTFEVTIE